MNPYTGEIKDESQLTEEEREFFVEVPKDKYKLPQVYQDGLNRYLRRKKKAQQRKRRL